MADTAGNQNSPVAVESTMEFAPTDENLPNLRSGRASSLIGYYPKACPVSAVF